MGGSFSFRSYFGLVLSSSGLFLLLSEPAQQSIQPMSQIMAVMGIVIRRSLRFAIWLLRLWVWVAPNRETHATPQAIDVSTICIYNLCTNWNGLLFLRCSIKKFLCCCLSLVFPEYSGCGEDYRQCEQAENYGCLAYSPRRVVQEQADYWNEG